MASYFALVLNGISMVFSQGLFPLYTIPDHLGPWTPIDLSHLHCPNNLYTDASYCTTEQSITYTELKVGSSVSQKIPGFTCTGVRTESVTYTNFVGYVTTTFKKKHFPPKSRDCREAYERKKAGDPRYEESLAHPYPDNSWLRTVTTTKDSWVIIEPSVVELDIYTSALYSPLFKDGTCSKSRTYSPYCPTNHDFTIWMPESENIRSACNLFSTSRGKLVRNRTSTCGIIDERGLFRSVKGACKISICGRQGIRLVDGTWMSFRYSEYLPVCSPSQLINTHDIKVDELENAIVLDLIRRREECLDTLETILMSGSVSHRRLSHFRKLVPGSGKAYSYINGTLMESDAHYIKVENWSEVIPHKGCLMVGGKCYEPVNDVYFNGIIRDSNNQILIPEMQSSLLREHVDLLKANIVPFRHPMLLRSFTSDTEEDIVEFVNPHLQDTQKLVSDMDLGLSDWKRYLLIGSLAVGGVVAILFIGTCCLRCRAGRNRRTIRSNHRSLSHDVVFHKDKDKVITSWESYKGQTAQ
ncbi:glycoprotein [Lyssavirus caucasicus]|uniref:Glycoprotein n=1 Tax=West Caucasian bat virus TaxID=249584 RepID=GLYCO_WCBV|nr:glycoprotein [Lyssavirus caucasicus]Q5VKN9.1 RecName: Full=Glycoprotein; Flags: Precursor [Lyssavirus caucasicus]AAR03484.1 glycoprotein [Lyssavirus caucasicus]